MDKSESQIIIFKTDDEKISVDVRFDEETVWLTLDQMAALFERDKSTISRHIKNVFDEYEPPIIRHTRLIIIVST